MGLDISHNCFSGAYSAFMRLRIAIAHAAGLPPLQLMEGFYDDPPPLVPRFTFGEAEERGDFSDHPLLKLLPIPWDYFAKDPLAVLLNHSDCDGEIEAKDCAPLADRLEEILPKLPEDGGGHLTRDGGIRAVTEKLIRGLRAAGTAGENVRFV